MISFDCHAHVYECVAAINGARYAPGRPAPLKTWLRHLDRHRLVGGVIVQVSFLGTDNSQLCSALAQLDTSRFAGVAVVDITVQEEELVNLKAKGVRGVRWNLVRGAPLPDLESAQVRRHLELVRRNDLHLEVHLEGHRLAKVLPRLVDHGVRVVVDHFGLPERADCLEDPWLNALQATPDRSLIYAKFSAPYRTAFDVADHAHRLSDLLTADHVVWGSDWPHTQHEAQIDYDASAKSIEAWPLLDDATAVREIYGLSAQK